MSQDNVDQFSAQRDRQSNQLTDSESASDFLVQAVKEGRPIVPFLGAGVSAGSGFPLTDGLREYLCKVKFFIRYSVYRRLLGDDLPSLSSLSADSLEFSPAKYLVEFGWPDFNRLSADLWRYAERYREPMLGRYGVSPNNSPSWLDESLLQQSAVAAALNQMPPSVFKKNLEIVVATVKPEMLKIGLQSILRATRRHPLWNICDTLFTTSMNLDPSSFRAAFLGMLQATPPVILHEITQQFLSEWMPSSFRKDLFEEVLNKYQPPVQVDAIKHKFRDELLSTEYLNRCYTEFVAAANNGTDSRFNSFRTCQAGEFFQRIHDGRPVWAWERNRLNSIVQFMLLDLLKTEDRARTELIEKEVWKNQLRLHVDWFKLLHDVVEGRRGLADELLAQLNRDREPSLSHLMLAHLTRRLGWRLILTLNHDTLLEKAYITEGVSHKVFDVSAVSGVPDAALLRREPLSVVKLHGSAFGLRLGESTNDELDDSTRKRLLEYIPHNAVLLVVGFSGYERRMMSVIESIAAFRGDSRRPTILWMHWEAKDDLPAPVKRLQERLNLVRQGEPILLHRLEDAGAFLKGFYQRITHTLPETRTRYEALPKRVMANTRKPADNAAKERYIASNNSGNPGVDSPTSEPRPHHPRQEPVQLFVRDYVLEPLLESTRDVNWISRPPFQNLVVPAIETHAYLSTGLSAFVRSCRGYDVIWIDLEEHHTVTGVVTDIISRMRVFDPTLPPLVLPVTEIGSTGRSESERFGRAARYIQRAIRRGRYILAFDSVEGFGRPQTAHHGLTSVPRKKVDDLWRRAQPSKEKKASDPHNQLRIFEQYLYSTLHAADDTADGNDHSVAIRDRLAGYRRLIDLLDFLQTLLRVKPRQNSGTQAGNENVPSLIPPERGTDPLTVDWYCCFAIDVPQPRHHDGEDRSGDKRINRISYADLTYFALQRFCQDLQTVLGCRLYNVPFSASFSNEPDARFPFPNVAFPQSLRIGVTRIPPPKTEELKPPKPSVLPQPLEKLCRELQEINTGKFPTDQGMQKLIDKIVSYSLCRFSPQVNPVASVVAAQQLSPSSSDDATTLFFLLSMFRRPRNLSSIVALAERLQALFAHQTDAEQYLDSALSGTISTRKAHFPFDVDDILKQLRKCELLHLTEGELYFISQHVHEVAYKSLSGPVRLTTWKCYSDRTWESLCKKDFAWICGSQASEHPLGNAILRAAWLGRVHSLIGRHYYVHIWQRSHDPNALFEYLYHRLASLRYFKLLRTRLKLVYDHVHPKEHSAESTSQRVSEMPALQEGYGFFQLKNCLRIPELLDTDTVDRQHESVGHLTEMGLQAGLVVLLKRIDSLREEYVNALINVMERERATVLASAPAETWLNWVRQLRGPDLGETFGGNLEAATTSYRDAWREDWTKDVSVTIPKLTGHSALRERLDVLLLNLEGSLYREMGAFVACINSRLHLLKRILDFPDTLLDLSLEEFSSRSDASRDSVEDKALKNVQTLFDQVNKEEGLTLWIERAGFGSSSGESSSRLMQYGGTAKLIHSIEAAFIDIAASSRHLPRRLRPNENSFTADALLGVFSKLCDAIAAEFDKSRSPASAGDDSSFDGTFSLPELTRAGNALQVAQLRCEFERRRLDVDRLTKFRFAGRDFLGRVTKKLKKDHALVSKCLRKIHQTERKVYGAPFVQELDFILQVSRFAVLRAILLTQLGTKDSLRESLRLFDEAESGLSAHDSAHIFHRVIIHLERAHTMMLLADAAVRRVDAPDNDALRRYDHYRDDTLPSALVVAEQMLATADTQLTQAETILKSGRRNVRIWKRLYVARAQLAIEELLRLTLVVEFDYERLGHEHLFVAEIQECLLTGLESIRGALDCSVYPETPRRTRENDDNSDQEPTIAEREDYAEALIHYLQLFVVARLVLRAYGARPNCDTGRHGSVAFRMQSMMRLNGDQRFIDRWEALNDSVGLSRTFQVFDIRAFPEFLAQQVTPGSDSGVSESLKSSLPQQTTLNSTELSDSNLLSWLDILNCCDDPTDTPRQNGNSGRAETLRELALLKMHELFTPRPILGWGSEAELNSDADDNGKPKPSWIINKFFEQRNWLYNQKATSKTAAANEHE